MLFRAVRDHPAIIKKKQNRTSCHLLQSGCARLCTKPQVPRDKQEPEPGGPTTEINTPRFRWGGADKPHANRMWCLTQLEKAEESRRRLPLRTGLDGAEEEPVILFFFIFGEPPDGVEGGATSSLASLFPVCEIGVRV